MYVGGPGSNQYGGRPRDSMCIYVATVKIIPTTSRVCHLLQLTGRHSDAPPLTLPHLQLHLLSGGRP